MQLFLSLVLFVFSFAATAESCRPFVLETKVDEFSVFYTRTCIESEVLLSMGVRAGKNKVSVDTGTLYSSEVNIKKAILRRIVNGTSDADNWIILKDIMPALRRGDEETAKRYLTELILTE